MRGIPELLPSITLQTATLGGVRFGDCVGEVHAQGTVAVAVVGRGEKFGSHEPS